MKENPNRRRFLELAGTGTALTLAGCNGGSQTTTTIEESPTSADPSQQTTQTSSPEPAKRDVAVAVQADQQELQKQQQQLQSELKAGNISRQEAAKQFQSVKDELRNKAVSSFRERVGSTSALSISDSVSQYGILLVSGSPTTLIDSLDYSEVSALLPIATFEQAKSQSQQQTPGN